jgi:hypothetical protein
VTEDRDQWRALRLEVWNLRALVIEFRLNASLASLPS